jgi:hypothetical protein
MDNRSMAEDNNTKEEELSRGTIGGKLFITDL